MVKRPWTRAESLDAAALALALAAIGWIPEQQASLAVALHCYLFRSGGQEVREVANALIPSLAALPDDEVPGACARWLSRDG